MKPLKKRFSKLQLNQMKILREFRDMFGHIFDIAESAYQKEMGIKNFLMPQKLIFQNWLLEKLKQRDFIHRKIENENMTASLKYRPYRSGMEYQQFLEFIKSKEIGKTTLHIGPGFVCMPTEYFNKLSSSSKFVKKKLKKNPEIRGTEPNGIVYDELSDIPF